MLSIFMLTSVASTLDWCDSGFECFSSLAGGGGGGDVMTFLNTAARSAALNKVICFYLGRELDLTR